MKTFFKFVWVLVAVSSALAQNPTNSHGSTEPVNAGLLHNICKRWVAAAPDKPVGFDNVCQGYLNGWSWGIERLLMPDDNGFVGVVSFEEGVTGLQMAKVFVLYIENHPEEENKPAHVALMHSMLDAKLVTLASPGKDAPR